MDYDNDTKLAKEAIDSQSACNPIALSNCLFKHMSAMLKNGIGMDEMKNNSDLKLILHQLCFLFGMEGMKHEEWSNAFNQAKTIKDAAGRISERCKMKDSIKNGEK